MTITPWGEASTLRERRLRPGPGVPRADVERNQRERLYAAMVAVATTNGYADTRVADVIEVAGVSRATFYGYFANREDCFLATLERIVAGALETTREQVGSQGTGAERARRALEVFAELVVGQPAAARLCLVESYAAGPAAIERVDTAMAGFEQLIGYVFEQMPDQGKMPEELVSALTGAIRKIVHTRLHRGTEEELVGLLPEVLDLLVSYRPPPRPLVATPFERPPAAETDRHSLPAGERIERATLERVAADGPATAAIASIAAVAGVSLSTFYAQFGGKERALELALDHARARLWAAVEPAVRASNDWPEAVRGGLDALFGFHEVEPDFSRVVTADVYAAGAGELERLDRSIERMRPFLEGGYELSPQVTPAAREVIPSAMYSMLRARVADRGTERLRELTPLATYLVLRRSSAQTRRSRRRRARSRTPHRSARPKSAFLCRPHPLQSASGSSLETADIRHTERPQATLYIYGPTGIYRGHLKYVVFDALPMGLAVDNTQVTPGHEPRVASSHHRQHRQGRHLGLSTQFGRLRTAAPAARAVRPHRQRLGPPMWRVGDRRTGTFEIGPAGCGPIKFAWPSCTGYLYPGSSKNVTFQNEAGKTVEVTVNRAAFEMKYCGVIVDTAYLSGRWRVSSYGNLGEQTNVQVGSIADDVFLSGKKSEVEGEKPKIEADLYPTVLADNGAQTSTFTFAAAKVKCTSSEYDAPLSVATTSLIITPQYSSCVSAGVLPTTFVGNGCRWKLTVENVGPPYQGSLGVQCDKPGESLEFRASSGGSVICTTKMGEQAGRSKVGLENVSGTTSGIGLNAELSGLSYEHSGSNCNGQNGSHTDGALSAKTSLFG